MNPILKSLLEDEDDEILDANEFLDQDRNNQIKTEIETVLDSLYAANIIPIVTPVLKRYAPEMKEVKTRYGAVLVNPPEDDTILSRVHGGNIISVLFMCVNPDYVRMAQIDIRKHIQKLVGKRHEVTVSSESHRKHIVRIFIHLGA